MSADAARPTAAILMAAGRSTRMKSDLPKVVHEICGRPMLAFVVDACRAAGIDELHVVVGYGKERVRRDMAEYPAINWVEQAEQKGTGHAVQMCEPHLRDFTGDVIVIAGDMPLVRRTTIEALVDAHRRGGNAVTLATTELEDPKGYGRILRDAAGRLIGIREERDCSDAQRAIREVNPSYYCFDAPRLFAVLRRIDNQNAKGEYYLTDAVGLLIQDGEPADAVQAVPPEDATGVNSQADLALVDDMMRRRIDQSAGKTAV